MNRSRSAVANRANRESIQSFICWTGTALRYNISHPVRRAAGHKSIDPSHWLLKLARLYLNRQYISIAKQFLFQKRHAVLLFWGLEFRQTDWNRLQRVSWITLFPFFTSYCGRVDSCKTQTPCFRLTVPPSTAQSTIKCVEHVRWNGSNRGAQSQLNIRIVLNILSRPFLSNYCMSNSPV
jgi:hypothetical protein